jgi:hypothetical protein
MGWDFDFVTKHSEVISCFVDLVVTKINMETKYSLVQALPKY